jgi:hypothetical protein
VDGLGRNGDAHARSSLAILLPIGWAGAFQSKRSPIVVVNGLYIFTSIAVVNITAKPNIIPDTMDPPSSGPRSPWLDRLR